MDRGVGKLGRAVVEAIEEGGTQDTEYRIPE